MKNIVLRLATVDLPAQSVAVVPLAKIESRIGHGIGGIVGADLFKRYVVTIDYATKRITLDEPNTFAYHGKGEVTPIRLSGNRPFFKADITPISATPIEAKFVIDTGDNSTVTFHTPFVKKHNLLATEQILIPHVSQGLSGESRSWRGRVSRASALRGFIGIQYCVETVTQV